MKIIFVLLFFAFLLSRDTSVPRVSAAEFPSILDTVLSVQDANAADYRIRNEVIIFDLWKCFDQAGIKDTARRADIIYMITSLQGIVNRDKPRLYIIAALALFDIETRVCVDPNYKDKPVTELDEFWLREFKSKGYLTKTRRISDIETLIHCFRNEIDGLALWTIDVPATVNVALISAGCENLLPVSRDMGDGWLRKWLGEKFPDLIVTLDLTGRFDGKSPVKLGEGRTLQTTGSAKNDAYHFAIERYLKNGKCNPYYMWYNCDAAMWGALRNHYAVSIYGHLGDRNELQQNGMFNADYWVSKQAFILDLSPWGDAVPNDDKTQKVGTDLATWNDILEISYKRRNGEFGLLGGFVPWWIKYTDAVGDKHECVPTEWEYNKLATSYNMVNDADAAFGIANASFFRHLPQMTKDELKTPPPPKVAYKENTTYIAFCMLDYDASAWVNQMIPPIYNDSARGKIPLNWCINPILHLRIPHAMCYIYEHRTSLDYLGFAEEGAGYLHPLALTERQGRIKESGIPAYEKFAGGFYKRYGIDLTAFYISTLFTSPWIDMASRLEKRGFGFNIPMPQQMVNGVPVSHLLSFHVAQQKELDAELKQVFESSVDRKGYSPVFKAYRCILVTPGMITDKIERLRREFPEAKVEVVDLRNFYALLGEKLRRPLVSPFREAKEVSAKPGSAEGLTAVPSAGALFEVEMVMGELAWIAKKQESGLYLCFDLDDAFAQQVSGKAMDLEVTYLDRGNDEILLQYDSTDPAAPLNGTYKDGEPRIRLEDTGKWRTAKFRLTDAGFSGRQNDLTDLRFAKIDREQIIIKSVTLRPAD